ncbi:MAG: hypothetical protein GC205_02045 [Bacteroidetes bacterium]|nr:hypothetical protein [Bacteroidota bacterium]
MRILTVLLISLSFLFGGCNADGPCDACPLNVDPVCGLDGVPYSNPCEARCAGVSYVYGFCEEEADALILDLGAVAADGCDFMLLIDNEYYHPQGMDSVWRVHNTPVRVQFRRTLQFFHCGFLPLPNPVLEVLSVELQ